MKKNLTLFVSLLLIIAMLFTGCSSSDPSDAWKDPNKPDETMETVDPWKDPGDPWKDPSKPSESQETTDVWVDPSDPWKDPSKPSESEETTDVWVDPGDPWKDPSKPSESSEPTTVESTEPPTEPSTSEPTTESSGPTADGYRHEINGWVFYTKHNINDYIRYDGGDLCFFASEMSRDVFGIEPFFVEDGCVDTKIDGHIQIRLLYGRMNRSGTPTSYDGEYVGFMIIYHNYEIVIKDPYIEGEKYYWIDDSGYLTDYDIAVLSLYICENIEGWNSKARSVTAFFDEAGYNLIPRFTVWENGYDCGLR